MSHRLETVKQKLSAADKIYFVCSGNIIRSSFAHLYARHLGIENIDSFGTRYHNTSIHPRSKDELINLGVASDIIEKFHPKHVDEIQPINQGDCFFVMTQNHMDDLLSLGFDRTQIFFLTNLLGKNKEISDPYFEGNYEQAYSTISKAIDQLRKLLQ